MIEEKMSTSSRASVARLSRAVALLFVAVSISRRNNRLSFAYFATDFHPEQEIFSRASSASIQFAATDPDARTNCRTSSTLLIVLGNCLTKLRIASANRNVRSSRSRRFAPSSILKLGFGCLPGIRSATVICGRSRGDRLLCGIGHRIGGDDGQAAVLENLLCRARHSCLRGARPTAHRYLTSRTAVRMPLAMTSHFMMPPKMLTKIPPTFLSAHRILKASVTCSVLAPPPTSRKLAGSPRNT